MSDLPPLRLVALESWPLALPLKKPMRLASETVRTAETLLVRAVAEDGTEGWGEASSAPTMTGDLLPGMVAATRRFLAPALLAASLADGAGVAQRLSRAISGNTGAKAAAEAAVLDLLARRAGVPLAALLGGACRDVVPAIRMVGEADAALTLAQVRDAATEGCTHIKLKLGMAAAPEADAAVVAEARRIAGAAVHLSGDANMAWSAEQALRFLHALPAGVLDYLEQPVPDDDLAGMAACVAAGRTEICFDEGLHGAADIVKHAQAKAAQGVGLKAIKLGGLLATVAADALARAHGLRSTLASKIAESSIGCAATLHMACVVPDVSWGVSVTQAYLEADVVPAPIVMAQGQARLPAGPGLGLAPDMALLRRYTWKDQG